VEVHAGVEYNSLLTFTGYNVAPAAAVQGFPMQKSPLSQRVYDELYGAMLTGRLGPGDRLNRREVAEDLGVSVAPVLEAMTQLEWEGFLTTRPRRGTMVSDVTAATLLGRFHLRVAIEAQAARIYAGPQIRAVASHVQEMAAAVDATPPATWQSVKSELQFHQGLVDVAANGVLSQAFAQVMQHGLYYAAKRLLPKGPPRHPHVHERLVEKLLRADAEEADRLMRLHLEPWIDLLTKAAAAEPVGEEMPDPRGKTRRLKSRKKLRSG